MALALAASPSAQADTAYTDAIALDCYFPIPADYRFNTRERDHFTWYLPDSMKSARVNIIDGGDVSLAEYELLDRKQEGYLTILRLRFKDREGKRSLPYPLNEVVAISSSSQRAMLYGAAKSHANYMVTTCLANPVP